MLVIGLLLLIVQKLEEDPQGYVAYSTKIDTTLFLQNIEKFSEAEKSIT
jgi:hypothetical protein